MGNSGNIGFDSAVFPNGDTMLRFTGQTGCANCGEWEYKASNGVVIKRRNYPEFKEDFEGSPTIYVQGVETTFSKGVILTIPSTYADRVLQALHEYNWKFFLGYSEYYQIIGWSKDKPDDSDVLYADCPEVGGEKLLIERKKPTVPTGSDLVGLLCWVSDRVEIPTETESVGARLIVGHQLTGSEFRCDTPTLTGYRYANPLTPDELQEYARKAEAAFEKVKK